MKGKLATVINPRWDKETGRMKVYLIDDAVDRSYLPHECEHTNMPQEPLPPSSSSSTSDGHSANVTTPGSPIWNSRLKTKVRIAGKLASIQLGGRSSARTKRELMHSYNEQNIDLASEALKAVQTRDMGEAMRSLCDGDRVR